MGGQMGGGSGRGAGVGMAAWLELRERRIRVLEAENQELRRHLDALRQGIGITVLIDGHPMPHGALTSSASAPVGSPVIPTDTRPTPAPSRQAGSRTPIERPHISQQGCNPYAPRASGPMPTASGYAFERPWQANASVATAVPALQSGLSLPSMPTTQVPIPAARPAVRPSRATGAHDSSWLTDERPAVPRTATGSGPAPSMSTDLQGGEDAWLRSGAAWPQPAQRPIPALSQPDKPMPAAPLPARPVSLPQDQAIAERNVFADSFIL